MKKIFVLLGLLLPMLLAAQNVTEHEARTIAQKQLQKAATRSIEASDLRMVYNGLSAATRSAEDAPYFVFEDSARGGFVIVAGDERAMPVLGFSAESTFPTEAMPANMRYWMDFLARQIAFIRTHNLPQTEGVAAAWSRSKTRAEEHKAVIQHTTARWDQSQPYNNMCPKLPSGVRAYTGCTATAVAILMQFHRWPEAGVGTLPAFVSPTLGFQVPGLTLGFPYDWKNMLNTYPRNRDSYTKEQGDAVAMLMRDVSISLESDFTNEATSAYTMDIPRVMETHFRYEPGARIELRDNMGDDRFIPLLQKELKENGPIIYGGYTVENFGHAFILDGYTEDGYFGVNWGWSGMYNGYFLLSALEPQGPQGIGGATSGFNYGQDAVIGLRPARNAHDDPRFGDLCLSFKRELRHLIITKEPEDPSFVYDMRIYDPKGNLILEAPSIDKAGVDFGTDVEGGRYRVQIFAPGEGGVPKVNVEIVIPKKK